VFCGNHTHSPVAVKITITTSDDDLCKIIKPNVTLSSKRFEALKSLSEAGIFCGVLMMPILPFINDTEENITEIVCQAKKTGARFIYPAFGMSLRQGSRDYYYKKLDEHFPGIKEKYMARYRNNYRCTSPKAKKLWGLFVDLCVRHEILYDMRSITRVYKSTYDCIR